MLDCFDYRRMAAFADSGRRSMRWSPIEASSHGGIMFRISSLSLLVIGVSLAACDVQVHPPVVVVEKQPVVVVEKKPAPVEIHIDDKR
jgi:hypothetical protein